MATPLSSMPASSGCLLRKSRIGSVLVDCQITGQAVVLTTVVNIPCIASPFIAFSLLSPYSETNSGPHAVTNAAPSEAPGIPSQFDVVPLAHHCKQRSALDCFIKYKRAFNTDRKWRKVNKESARSRNKPILHLDAAQCWKRSIRLILQSIKQ